MTKASDNAFPSILITEGTEPSAPAAGKQRLYIDSTTHKLKRTDSSGTDVTIESAGSGSVATDTLWDTAGDLAVGSGADTAIKLVKGAAGGVLSQYNGVVAWNSGTSFPATPATGNRYWRSDHLREYVYDGTRWLSTQVFKTQLRTRNATTTGGDYSSPISATTATTRAGAPSVLGAADIYLVDAQCVFTVASGGTALGGSHKWVGTLTGNDTTPASTGTVATFNIDSGSSSVWRTSNASIAAVQAAGTLFYQMTWTKTGTPGTLTEGVEFTYRIIAT